MAAAPFTITLERICPRTKLIGLRAVGHLVGDVMEGSFPAVVPLLVAPLAGFAAARFRSPSADR